MVVMDKKVPYSGRSKQTRKSQDIWNSVDVFMSFLRNLYPRLFRSGSNCQTEIVDGAWQGLNIDILEQYGI